LKEKLLGSDREGLWIGLGLGIRIVDLDLTPCAKNSDSLPEHIKLFTTHVKELGQLTAENGHTRYLVTRILRTALWAHLFRWWSDNRPADIGPRVHAPEQLFPWTTGPSRYIRLTTLWIFAPPLWVTLNNVSDYCTNWLL